MSKQVIRDIVICTLFIISIAISERFFPDSLILRILIGGLGVLYFGGKIWIWFKGRKSENRN